MSQGSVIVIIEVQEVIDEAAHLAYREQARVQLLERGAELIGRGGTLFEGQPAAGSAVLVQRWPSEEAFRAWQASPEYAPLRAIREKAARIRILIVNAVG